MAVNILKTPHMEDVNRAVCALFEQLDKDGIIKMDDPEHDMLFNEVSSCLEMYFGYPDYANYN